MRQQDWIEEGKAIKTGYKVFAIFLIMVLALSISPVFHSSSAFADTGGFTSHGSSYSGGRSSYSGGHGSAGSFLAGFIIRGLLGRMSGKSIAIIVVIIVIWLFVSARNKSTGYEGGNSDEDGYAAGDYHPPDPVHLGPVDLRSLRERDPNFSETKFLEKVNNMFLQLQDSWTRKDWKPIRPFETDSLFNQHARQLQKFIDSKTTNVVDDIGILGSSIAGCEQDGAYDVLKVQLNTRIKDYVTDDETGNVIEGDPDQEIFMDYIWRMIRKQGIQTKVDSGTSVSQCPNCGANISINASGECEYCGSIVTSGEHDWVLSSIELVSQY